MQVQIIGNIISALIKFSLVFIFKAELIYFVYAFVFDILLVSIGYILTYNRKGRSIFNWNYDKELAKKLLHLSWPLIISGIMVSVYMKIDTIMLKEILGDDVGTKASGAYATVVMFSEALNFIPVVIVSSLFPAILNAKRDDPKRYQKRLQNLFDLMVWLSLAFAIFISFAARNYDVKILIFGNSISKNIYTLNKFTALATLISKPKRLNALLSYGHKGYLATIGWFTAFDTHQAVDQLGNPLPWVTYSFIDFIKTRLNKELTIFEYGSGNSTLFYAKRVKRVVSVEHDEAWFNKIAQEKAKNAEMIFTALEKGGEYSKKAILLDEKFDLIIVDGRDRVNCCKNSVDALTPNGVLVLDDSEREIYQEARDFLMAKGFKELPFTGISPGLFYNKTTSIFYKADNCLAI